MKSRTPEGRRVRRLELAVFVGMVFCGIGVLSPAVAQPAGAATPARMKEYTAGDSLGRSVVPDGVRVYADVAYRPGGHKRWTMDIAVPDAALGTSSGDLRAALFFIHGGGWRGGNKRNRGFLDGAMAFAQKGYVGVTVNYRLVWQAPFPACIEDVKCAVRWLRAHAADYDVDPDRIGAFGYSAGAHLALMLGLCPPSAGLEGDGPWQDVSSRVQAVVCTGVPVSFELPMHDPETMAHRHGRSHEEGARMMEDMSDEDKRRFSPLTYVNADAPPLLIIQDVSDQTVWVKHADTLAKALADAGARNVSYLRYDMGLGHDVFSRNPPVTGPAREQFFEWALGRR